MKKIVTLALAALAAACTASVTAQDRVPGLRLDFEPREDGAGRHPPSRW